MIYFFQFYDDMCDDLIWVHALDIVRASFAETLQKQRRKKRDLFVAFCFKIQSLALVL